MKSLIFSIALLFCGLSASSQIAFTSLSEIRSYGAPTVTNTKYTPYIVYIANNRSTLYLWDDVCGQADDGVAHIRIAGTSGCWERSTNAYPVAGVGIVREMDTLRADVAYLNSKYAAKDSFTTWQQAVINGYYTKDQSDARYQSKTGMIQYPTNAQIEQRFTDFATFAGTQFYPISNPQGYLKTEVDGSSSNELQALSISGQSLSISNGNTVTIPSNTGPQGMQGLTGATGTQGAKGDKGDPGPTYTGGSGITVAGTVISFTGKQTIQMPDVTVAESSLLTLALSVRKVTVTCSGIVAGDRVQVFPKTSIPAGYGIVSVVASATNTLEIQVLVPVLGVGSSYSIPCYVLVWR